MALVSRLRVEIVSLQPKKFDDVAKWMQPEVREAERQRILEMVLGIVPSKIAAELRQVLQEDARLWRFSGEDDVPLCDMFDVRWYVSPSDMGVGYVIDLASPRGLWTISEAKGAEELLSLKNLPEGGEVSARLVDGRGHEDKVAEEVQTANLISGRHWSSNLA